ncbi:MAG: CBS domain-containing protein, partial [Solirubrobacterales bacterium]|nr:CBS domain-containing protein [Solirubrobacterales bacterium]
RQGIETRRIDLFLFGGLTHMSRDAVTPGEDFKIAAAGPLATACFLLVCLAITLGIVGPHRFFDAARLSTALHITPVLLSLSWLVLMNVLILAFNLVPAFPLDGGRMARAIVWRLSGSKASGTRAAATTGRGFAFVLAGFGLWVMLGLRSPFTGIWLLAIAFLLGSSARGALVQTALNERIEGVRVADIMDTQPVAIPSTTAVGEALDAYFLRYGWDWFPVVDERERFLGIVRRGALEAARDRGEGWLTVGAALESDEAARWRVGLDRPLAELLSSEPLAKLGALMAVDGEGVLRGVVTIEQVRRALQSAFSSPAM